MLSYLVLVKLIHGLCDSITVIHSHHPGKPGDKASIPWRWVGVREEFFPGCLLGIMYTLPGVSEMLTSFIPEHLAVKPLPSLKVGC